MGSLNNPAVPKRIASGTYTGDDSTDRQIVVGFKCSEVILVNTTDPRFFIFMANAVMRSGGALVSSAYMALHATDGFRVEIAATADAGNDLNDVFYYWAISE